MPVVKHSSYIAPLFLRNGHFNTFFSSIMRKLESVPYVRERIVTPDNDFLDLDWSKVNGKKCVVLAHGLEGNSDSSYIRGMVQFFNSLGWDAVCWNLRGCSGEPNITSKLYHSGCVEDLDCVIKWVNSKFNYEAVSLVGFSLGGNVVLKYLGEMGKSLVSSVKGAVCFSVPCDLRSSAEKLACPTNRLYMRSFLKSVRIKLEQKLKKFPGLLSFEGFEQVKNFFQFDEKFTAPLHGYMNAEDYYLKCSSKQFLSKIAIPTLLISAKDDPMLGRGCFPVKEAEANDLFFLETPDHGGHAGFCNGSSHGVFWSETRTAQFLDEHVGL